MTTISFDDMPSTAVNEISDSKAAPIFLQTRAAQGIAGAFVWVALFLTCQQVLYNMSFITCAFVQTLAKKIETNLIRFLLCRSTST